MKRRKTVCNGIDDRNYWVIDAVFAIKDKHNAVLLKKAFNRIEWAKNRTTRANYHGKLK